MPLQQKIPVSVAAIKDEEGVYSLTDDLVKAAKQPEEKVAWVQSMEELQDHLDKQYGRSPSGLPYYTVSYGSCKVRGFPVYSKYIQTDEDVREMLRHLEQDNKLYLEGPPYRRTLFSHYGLTLHKYHYVEYDKAKMARRLKARKEREFRQPVSLSLMRLFNSKVERMLNYAFPISERIYRFNVQGRDTEPLYVHRCATHFDLVFGRNAHRKLPEFKMIVDEWRLRREINEKAHAHLPEFLAWFEQEVNVRQWPTLVTNDSHWTVPLLKPHRLNPHGNHEPMASEPGRDPRSGEITPKPRSHGSRR